MDFLVDASVFANTLGYATHTPTPLGVELDVMVADLSWSYLIRTSLLAGICSGIIAATCSLMIEKLGGKLGGILATVPTSAVPSMVGFWTAQANFDQAAGFTPVGMLANCTFLLSWKYYPRYVPAHLSVTSRVAILSAASLTTWLLCGSLLIFGLAPLARAAHLSPQLLGFACSAIHISIGLAITYRPPPAPRGGSKVPLSTLLLRGVVATIIITCAIIIGKVANGYIASLASIAPIVFLTSMIATSVSQGDDVRDGAIGPMLLGSSSVGLYCNVATVFFRLIGPYFGSAVCWVIAVFCVNVPAFFWIGWRRGVMSARSCKSFAVDTMPYTQVADMLRDDDEDMSPLASQLQGEPCVCPDKDGVGKEEEV